MALVHDVKFGTIREMVLAVTDVYLQFDPRDPIPKWWSKFKLWVEEQNIEELNALGDEIDKIEKIDPKERPKWYRPALKCFKDAKRIKVLTLRTEPFEADADADGDGAGDAEDGGGEDVLVSHEEPEENSEDEPEDEPEDDDGNEPEGEDGAPEDEPEEPEVEPE